MKSNRFFNTIHQKLTGLAVLCVLVASAACQAGDRDIYQIRIYNLDDAEQGRRMENFLKDAYLPALHRAGISHVGVFEPVEDAEMAGKLIYVFIPFESIDQFEQLERVLSRDKEFLEDGSDYIDAAYDDAPYIRIESTLLRAFKSMPDYGIPAHPTPAAERIYELRSYQGATEKLYEKKVEMFTDGGESEIFMDLGFQPIFFGEVISGSIMPNLMYLTTFENEASQEEHWNAFRTSPDWRSLKADEQYRNTVSKSEKFYLHPTDYSDL